MGQIINMCRVCKIKTSHVIRIVTENLPPNVKVVECFKCGVMGIALIDDKEVD